MKKIVSIALVFATILFSTLKASSRSQLEQQFAHIDLEEKQASESIALFEQMTSLHLAEDEELSLGERALLHACKHNDSEHAEYLITTQKINPTIKDPETGLTPFLLAVHTDRNLAAFLLGNGAKPHAYLDSTESIYSESFRRGDTKALHFLLQKNIPYIAKKNRSNLARCRKEDLKRLLITGKFIPITQVFIAGLLSREILTPAVFAFAHKSETDNPHFDPRIIPYLKTLSEISDKKLRRLPKKK